VGCASQERAMERFVIRQNIDHYRRLLEQTSDEAARQQIRRLLKEEEEKLHAAKAGDEPL
jgi:hypothetical protein